MATLHMEVEVARSTQSSLANTHSQLLSTVQSVSGLVNNLQPTWIGNSATEFYGLYEQWHSQMNSLVEQLAQLNSRLQNEINEWETMASKLG